MKNFIALIGVCLIALGAYAQKPVSSIRFVATSQEPITVILNERDFNRVGRSITFKDIPKKRHRVEIYQIIVDNQTGNKRGIKLYSGNIKIEPGKKYDAILDIRTRNLRVKAVRDFVPLAGEYTNKSVIKPSTPAMATTPVQPLSDDIVVPLNFETNLNAPFIKLKKEMNAATLDKDKIQIATQFAASNAISAYEGRAILSWLLFEDSKTSLATTLKDKITDKENLDMLADAFSFEKTRTEFLKNLK
jgi:hypothetical protein